MYFPMNIISWVIWAKRRDGELDHITKSRKLSVRRNIIVAVVVIAVSYLIHLIRCIW